MEKFNLGLLRLKVLNICISNFCTKPLNIIMNTRPKFLCKRRKQSEGLFGMPELKSINGFRDIKEKCVFDAHRLVAEATSQSRQRKLVDIFDDLSDTLCKVADLAEFVRVAHPSLHYNHAAEKASSAVMELMDELNKNKHLYELLREVIANGDNQPMNEVEMYISRQFLLDFEQNGTHLPEAVRNKMSNVNDAISKLGHMFITEASKPKKIGATLPLGLLDIYNDKSEDILVSDLDSKSPFPIIRETTYRAIMQPDKRQEKIFHSLLKLRHQLARTTGFNTYAEKVIGESVFSTPGIIMDFLTTLHENIQQLAQTDFNLMQVFKRQETQHINKLDPWDVPYYTRKVNEELFKIHSYEYTPYFSLGVCMEGLSNLFTKLYGISFRNVEIKPGESWSHDIYKLAVFHDTNGQIGYIYCDLFTRRGKPKKDSHSIIRTSKMKDSSKDQLPIVVIMMDIPPPRGGPPLLTLSMVERLFYQMGHVIHPVLKLTDFQYVAASSYTNTDISDTPAKLMEYFSSDPRVLASFAKHYETNEQIPQELLDRLCASKYLFMASKMQHEIFYSILDQVYHGEHPLNGTTTEVLKEIQNRYYGLPFVENTAPHLRFIKLVRNGAQYYYNLLSQALASCIWQKYFQNDPFNPVNGESYRFEYLANIGKKPSKQMITEFLKEEPSPSLLANYLSKDVEIKTILVSPFVKKELDRNKVIH